MRTPPPDTEGSAADELTGGRRSMYELGQQFIIRNLSRHLYVIGRSGAGKTVLLENLARQLRGGFALLDPHGDSAERCLDFLDPDRTIYFDAGDLSHVTGADSRAIREPRLEGDRRAAE